MKIVKTTKSNTKEEYKKAICDACDDIKNRVDDFLCDFDKHIAEMSITIKVGIGEVSVINLTKQMYVEGEEKVKK